MDELERLAFNLADLERGVRVMLARREWPHVDRELCEAFGAIMARKADLSAYKHGRTGPDWQTWTREEWERQTAEHISKGDPRDVAVYMAIGWARGWDTAGVRRLLFYSTPAELDAAQDALERPFQTPPLGHWGNNPPDLE